MAKQPLSFKDFMAVDYTPGMPELVSYRAQKRHRGVVGEETEVEEGLSLAARRKLSRMMKTKKSRIKMGRERALKRTPDTKTLKKRAERLVRNQMLKKLTKGIGRDELSTARKQELEKRLDKMKPRLQRMAKKAIPQLRQIDRERKQGKKQSDD